jgi:flagellar biosynthesis protein FliP
MSDDESSDYTRWVALANDPSQSEEARRQYRAMMEAYVHSKLREAFQSATAKASEASLTPRGNPVNIGGK